MSLNIKTSSEHEQGQYKPENVPAELQELQQFVCWRYAQRDGEWTKVPINPFYTGSKARSNDPKTWSVFKNAVGTWEANPRLDGFGFVFTEEDSYTGIDFDDCVDESGTIDPWVADWIKRLGGYVELSPSGTGVKVWVRGKLPGGGRARTVVGHEVEMYDKSRYFALTGWVMEGYDTPADAQSAVEELYAELAPRPKERAAKKPGAPRTKPDTGEPIPEGARHPALVSVAGRLHDGTRSMGELIADLLEVNNARCNPPLPEAEVQEIASWTHQQEPCSPELPREIVDTVRALSEDWWAESWNWPGGYTDASMVRYLIGELRHIGTVTGGTGRVEEGIRDIAEALNIHKNTVRKSIARSIERGKIAREPYTDEDRLKGNCGAFLLTPRKACSTPIGAPSGEGATRGARPGVDGLQTAYYSPTGEVGKAGETTLCWFEGGVVRTAEELRERLGATRLRDVRRRRIEPLIEAGLLEDRSGEYAVPDDYRQRTDEAQERRTEKIVRRYEHSTGRTVSDVALVPSENEKRGMARERHKEERRRYLQWLNELAEKRRKKQEVPDVRFDELPATRKVEGPDGMIRWVNLHGEVLAEYPPKEVAA